MSGRTLQVEPKVEYTGITYWGHCLIFSIFSVLCLGGHIIFVRLLRGRTRQSGEPLLALESWRTRYPIVEGTMNFVTLLVFIVPTLLFVVSLLLATLLAFFEDWPYHMAFDYLICHAVNIGPIHPLTPSTTVGMVVDIVLSGLMLLAASLVIGVCGSLQIVGYTQKRVPDNSCGFIVSFVVILIVIWVMTGFSAVALAAIESADIIDAYLYLVGLLCGIQTPLTDFQIASNTGFFFASFCSIFELGASGAVIGILAGHGNVAAFVVWYDGEIDKTASMDKSLSGIGATLSRVVGVEATLPALPEVAVPVPVHLAPASLTEMEAKTGPPEATLPTLPKVHVPTLPEDPTLALPGDSFDLWQASQEQELWENLSSLHHNLRLKDDGAEVCII